MRANSLEASGKFRDSKARRAETRARPAFCSLCLVESAFHHTSPPPTTRITATHRDTCLCALIHAITRMSTSLSSATGRAVPTDVAMPLDPLKSRACCSTPTPPVSAPGVTRTPGQRFRKPLLYPPELQGRKRRNVEGLRIAQQGLDPRLRQPPAAVQEFELDQERESYELRPAVRHELASRLCGATRCQDVVHYQDLVPPLNSVLVHLQRVGAVLQSVFHTVPQRRQVVRLGSAPGRLRARAQPGPPAETLGTRAP